MSSFIIHGKKKLHGTAVVNTSKNAAVVLLNAALLNRGVTLLEQMPKIEEVFRIIEVLESIGVQLRWVGESNLEITPPKKLNLANLNYEAAIRTRSVVFLLGILIHHSKNFRIPQPGGCRLGKRTVTPHLFALEHFGVKITTERKYYHVTVNKRRPKGDIILYESGDTVTENVLMAAALTPGKTVIKFASANYQVQDLCFFLEKFGVKISGVGTTTLEVWGISRMNAKVKYALSEDPIEAMLFISIAATTNSAITIKRCPIDFLELELLKLEKMGWRYTISKRYLAHNGKTYLVDIKTLPSKLVALDEKIYGRPFPGLNLDNLPFFVPIATQAKGTTLIHDWAYEERAIYFTELNRLGAQAMLADPHRVFVTGPTPLRGNELMCPPALRPAVIIVVAMLAAEGRSVLRNVYSIDRGYEDLCGRLQQLGADIRRTEE
jgi:UDP-N-acetylglucosamine 1-carboxyvinyltransferase